MKAIQSFTALKTLSSSRSITKMMPVARGLRDGLRAENALSVRGLNQAPAKHFAGSKSSGYFDLKNRIVEESIHTDPGLLLGISPEIMKISHILAKVAHSTFPVLILGEGGTGKEIVARAIHMNGPNAAKPFVPVDCGSLMPDLIANELFGYVKGAFAGAKQAKQGLLSAAGGGTVFLDEIGELPLNLQARLLRALQEKEVRPMGAAYAVPFSARVLAATNCNLNTLVQQGRFRKDLYYRLNVVNLTIPPLRERRMDIAVLTARFLERMELRTGTAHSFSDEASLLMIEYDWPGNMRELENVIKRAVALSSGSVLQVADLSMELQTFGARRKDAELTLVSLATGAGLGSDESIVSIAAMEKVAILDTIERLNGDKLMAAKLLGIGKTTLYRKLKEYGCSNDFEVSKTAA
jgi:DNA-binding NtrC family response regulator